ncbi:MAG: aldo/keto reductase [Candidatus Ratteibacteria bacterium]|jgi:aryl-alcohol dehydrogenase-like predicted oxidoreductase
MKIKSTLWKDLSVSRLTLGTAQLGMPYGIANQTGKPSYTAARQIIEEAYSQGITTFDTAANYEESEKRVGTALKELGILSTTTVITKLSLPEELPREKARKYIEKSLCKSLKNLGLDQIPILLFHNEKNRIFFDILAEMKEKKYIAHAGISLTTPDIAKESVEKEEAEALQIPINVFDRRFYPAAIKASSQGIAIFARSIFLQGLLLMKKEAVPPHLKEILPFLSKLQRIADQYTLSISEIAIRYVLSLSGIHSLLFGAERIEQVSENAGYAKKGSLEPELVQTIHTTLPQLPDAIVSPWLWKKNLR